MLSLFFFSFPLFFYSLLLTIPNRDFGIYSVNGTLKNLSLHIIDIYGRVLLETPLDMQSGEHSYNIMLDKQFVSGVYSVAYYSDDRLLGTDRFIKK